MGPRTRRHAGHGAGKGQNGDKAQEQGHEIRRAEGVARHEGGTSDRVQELTPTLPLPLRLSPAFANPLHHSLDVSQTTARRERYVALFRRSLRPVLTLRPRLQFELGRQPASTKLGAKRIHTYGSSHSKASLFASLTLVSTQRPYPRRQREAPRPPP